MFLVRIGRFARSLCFDSFRSNYVNQHMVGLSHARTVVSHDSPSWEWPHLIGCTRLNIIHFLTLTQLEKFVVFSSGLNSIGTTRFHYGLRLFAGVVSDDETD